MFFDYIRTGYEKIWSDGFVGTGVGGLRNR